MTRQQAQMINALAVEFIANKFALTNDQVWTALQAKNEKALAMWADAVSSALTQVNFD
jgi:hypothetical protein